MAVGRAHAGTEGQVTPHSSLHPIPRYLLVLDLTGLNPGLDLVLVVLQLLDLLLEVRLELLLLVCILGVIDVHALFQMLSKTSTPS